MYKLYIKKNTSSKELLEAVLKKHKKKVDIVYNEYGKPYLKDSSLFFSLSHCGIYTVCAISDREIGVDIEKITYKPRVIKRICTGKEFQLVKSAKDFTKIWVKKESYVKYLGVGLEYGLKNVDTLMLKNIKVKRYKDCYIGICFNK